MPQTAPPAEHLTLKASERRAADAVLAQQGDFGGPRCDIGVLDAQGEAQCAGRATGRIVHEHERDKFVVKLSATARHRFTAAVVAIAAIPSVQRPGGFVPQLWASRRDPDFVFVVICEQHERAWYEEQLGAALLPAGRHVLLVLPRSWRRRGVAIVREFARCFMCECRTRFRTPRFGVHMDDDIRDIALYVRPQPVEVTGTCEAIIASKKSRNYGRVCGRPRPCQHHKHMDHDAADYQPRWQPQDLGDALRNLGVAMARNTASAIAPLAARRCTDKSTYHRDYATQRDTISSTRLEQVVLFDLERAKHGRHTIAPIRTCTYADAELVHAAVRGATRGYMTKKGEDFVFCMTLAAEDDTGTVKKTTLLYTRYCVTTVGAPTTTEGENTFEAAALPRSVAEIAARHASGVIWTDAAREWLAPLFD